jgi:hypothetical protein
MRDKERLASISKEIISNSSKWKRRSPKRENFLFLMLGQPLRKKTAER